MPDSPGQGTRWAPVVTASRLFSDLEPQPGADRSPLGLDLQRVYCRVSLSDDSALFSGSTHLAQQRSERISQLSAGNEEKRQRKFGTAPVGTKYN